jgi:Spy/CpxP family protein refolding chaperone
MFRAALLALFGAMLVLTGATVGQEPKTAPKQDAKKDEKKAEEPPAGKAKGVLPPNWKKLGLSDAQVQDIYKVQNKYDAEIDKLQAKIEELKAGRTKDMKAVLTAEQKKRLDDILTGKEK